MNILSKISIDTKKFISLLSIIMLIFFNNSVLRVLKDTLIISGNSSIETVHFVKSFLVMPASMLFIYFYTKLSLTLKQNKMIYYILSLFAIFFAIYSLFIHPLHYYLHPNYKTVMLLTQQYPSFKWLFILYGSWSYVLFYIFSELWTSVALNLIFWQFANSINNIVQAKKHYVLFSVLGNIGMILGGWLILHFFNSNVQFDNKISIISFIISLIIIVIMLIYKYIFNNIALPSQVLIEKPKSKFKFYDIIKVLIDSQYLRYMMLMVFCYHMTSNLIEITWKSIVRSYVASSSDYAYYMGIVYMLSGIVSILFFYISQQFIRRASWKTISLFIPLFLSVVICFFHISLMYSRYQNYNFISLKIIALIGSVYYICNRVLKYSLFDPTKEIAYIPLNNDLKLKGKAMIDVFGSKFSKAISGYIQAFLLMIIPGSTQISISYYLIYIVIFCLIIWVISIKKLFIKYEKVANSS